MSMKTSLMDSIGGLCGCSCKVKQDELEKLLEKSGITHQNKSCGVLAGIGEDAAVIDLDGKKALVKSLDFLTPVTDDPYIQGRIAVNNACNDLFAKGVTNILCVLTVLGLPKSSLHLGEEILTGMKDYVVEIDSVIAGGHTIYNPWPLTGAEVTGLVNKDKVIYNSNSKPGDILLLTKPLGIQAIVTAYQELRNQEGVDDLKKLINETMSKAVTVMKESSKPVAEVMQEVGVNAATDITGFGLYGHALEVARRSKVDLTITTIPTITGAKKLADMFGYSLGEGKTAETAGGILISLTPEKADNLKKALKKRKINCFEIGSATKGRGNVNIFKDVKTIEVE